MLSTTMLSGLAVAIALCITPAIAVAVPQGSSKLDARQIRPGGQWTQIGNHNVQIENMNMVENFRDPRTDFEQNFFDFQPEANTHSARCSIRSEKPLKITQAAVICCSGYDPRPFPGCRPIPCGVTITGRDKYGRVVFEKTTFNSPPPREEVNWPNEWEGKPVSPWESFEQENTPVSQPFELPTEDFEQLDFATQGPSPRNLQNWRGRTATPADAQADVFTRAFLFTAGPAAA
ncbi:hypothetical protein ABW20_dc0106117 [Dactylellina cionopaga]|nr:hypothetical protein ABW20_dc0106117 [Dactylellina cionopaga]